MALKAGRVGVNPRDVDAQGHVQTESDINPVAKTDAMTQPVGMDSEGKLFSLPGGLTLTKLCEKDSFTGDFDLSETVENYKLIVFVIKYVSSSNTITLSRIVPAELIVANEYTGVFNDTQYCYFVITSKTKFAAHTATITGISKVYIYGIK